MTDFDALFPSLRTSPFRVTSPWDTEYNCIAWALSINDQWLWPGTKDWPVDVPDEETVDAFTKLFVRYAFTACDSVDLEPGYDRVALFLNSNGVPTHAARQLPNGQWTRKLGRAEDIEHELRAIEGEIYGRVAGVFQRPALG